VGKAIAGAGCGIHTQPSKIQTGANADYLDCCASVKVNELEMVKWLSTLFRRCPHADIIDSPDPEVCAAPLLSAGSPA
jgi:hypothetical protein